MSVVFHLLAIFVNVVAPEDINTCRTRFSNCLRASSSTRKNACAVRSFVCSFWRFHTPSFCAKYSVAILTLGMIRTSNPHMLKSRFGLSREYTETNPLSHSSVVSDRGSRFRMSQNTALPRLTSCFIRRMRASRGQHFLLLYPTRFSLFGSGCSVRYRWMRSFASSAVKRNSMWILSMYLEYKRIGCLVSVRTSLYEMNSFGICGGPAISEARVRPSTSKSRTKP
mmetsp:Transcript_39079/g.93741  ORF Transcript_39079/g.93741 Transcript_39079/m.93741 type:complete len:225 (-) Transcript_39079:513-1187(-)